MSEINIDKLNIEVSASAEKASSNIDKLTESLKKLGSAIPRVKGLEELSRKLGEIASNSSMIGLAAANVAKMADSLKALNSVKLNVTNITNGIKKLRESMSSGLPEIGSMSDKITDFVSAVTPLASMPKISLGTLVKNLSELGPAVDAVNSSDMGRFMSNMAFFTSSVSELSGMKGGGFSSIIKGLKDIPSISETFDTGTLSDFAAHIREVVAALEPLLIAVNENQAGLVALNNIINANIRSSGNMASANAAAAKSFTSIRVSVKSFAQGISSTIAKVTALYFGMRRFVTLMSEALQSSNEYVENLNLFTVTMGKGADEAYRYAQRVNELLGIDVSAFIRYQGVFQQIVSGFGVIDEKAQLMSKNLTQIGYDISSFYNVDIETAMQKVQSGIAGELEPLRRLGYALDAATLQQVAYNHGITQNIANMAQAQKSQLRYTAILEQSKNVMGDMARTIITPANSMRILAQQMEQFKRAIGNIVSVIAAKLIPYMQAALKLLTEFANWLAQKMGFELPKIDYSNLGDGLSAVGEEADYATDALKAMEEASNFLAGFDEMERIPSLKDSGTGTADAGAGYDLNIDLPEYDFLAGLEKSTDDLMVRVREKLSKFFEPLKVAWDAAKEWINGIDFQPFKDALQEVKDALEPFGKDIGDGIKWVWDNVLEPISKWTMEAAVPVVLSLLAAALRLLRSAAKKLEKPGKWLWEKFLEPMMTFTGAVVIGFLEDLEDLLNDLTDLLDGNTSLSDFTGQLNSMQVVMLAFAGIFTGGKIIKGISGIASALKALKAPSWISGIAGFVTKYLVPLGKNILAWLSFDIPEILSLGLQGIFVTITSAVAAFFAGWKIGTYLKGILDEFLDFQDAFNIGMDMIVGFFRNAVEKIAGFFADLWDSFKIGGEMIGKFIVQDIPAFFSSAKQAIIDIFKNIGDWFGERWDDIKSAFRGVGSWFKEKFVAAKDRVHEAFDAIGTWFGNRWQDIKDVFSSVGTWFSEKFTDAEELIETAFSGLSEFFDGIWEGIKSGAVSAINGIIDFLNNWIDGAGGLINKIKTAVGGEEINFTHINHIQGYASGGYPTSGQLFIARENNMPEMVGRIGNQTAVANNDQITTAIANAVRQAMIEAAMVNGSSDRVINVDNHLYLDGKEVTDTVIRGINSKTKRNGKSPLLT